MLEALFGSKSVCDVLLFLFAHERCYASQIQRQLDLALTPIQKALERLEKGEILLSFYEGKTRFYQFNPAYPLYDELIQLLKKAQSQLDGNDKTLRAIWKRLKNSSSMTIQTTRRRGKGTVTVVEKDNVLLVTEKGSWDDMDFTNQFRWTLDTEKRMISYEVERSGVKHPLFCFYLKQDGLVCEEVSCGRDCYKGSLALMPKGLILKWQIRGPQKNEEIEIHYKIK